MRPSLWQLSQRTLRRRSLVANWTCKSCLLRRTSPFNAGRTYSSAANPEKEKPYFVTTPIFYVNADPHIGHLYTMVLTDVLKRWQLLLGRSALLSTGTDEHGMKIQQAAAQANTPPGEFCDTVADTFKNLADAANVSYDFFIRTTAPKHHDAVENIWHRLQEAGYIYPGKHEGWYSVSDETFYPGTSVASSLDPGTGQKIHVSTETGKPVEWTSETNYHFSLSALAPRLLSFYEQNPTWLVPASRYTEVIRAVQAGLADLSISRPRSRLPWGIPVPNDASQTIYVWLDALVNYLTVTHYPWSPPSTSFWPADTHVVGKDITRFHAVYWPAFLLALNITPPKQILTHAHWTANRRKMSKSTGNVVDPFYALQRFGVDTIRFYLLHDGGIVDDGDYDVAGLVERYRKSCQTGLGNLVGRVRGRTFDLRRAVQRGVPEDLTSAEKTHVDLLHCTPQLVAEKMESLEPNLALREIMCAVYATNKFLQHAMPWSVSDPTVQDRAIYLSAEAIRIVGILLQPFMPAKAKELLDGLGVAEGKRGFVQAVFGCDGDYGAMGEAEGKRAVLFPPLEE